MGRGTSDQGGATSRQRGVVSWRLWEILFGVALVTLLSLHVSEPWQFPNEDNGAWFSAVARGHVQAGLRATRGQDFFVARESGELVPYLHHPPAPGLILAAVFRVTGRDSPATARLTFVALHLLSFALIAHLAGATQAGSRDARARIFALAVAATAPMSAYYGKMPNHEVPGLLFFLLGVVAWGFARGPSSSREVAAACVAWALAVFSSWHATLCVLGWLAFQWGAPRRRLVAAALASTLASLALVVTHLLWAGDWTLLASQSRSAGYWFAGSDGASLGDRLGFLQHALGIGIERYAFLPALLSIAWILRVVADRARTGRGPDAESRALLGLGAGTGIYALAFPRAMSFHAYQGFYLIPFVALTSSVVLARLDASRWVQARPRLRGRWVAAAAALACVLGIAMTLKMYRKPSPRVVEVVGTIGRQYR